jgi:hypothetical protein
MCICGCRSRAGCSGEESAVWDVVEKKVRCEISFLCAETLTSRASSDPRATPRCAARARKSWRTGANVIWTDPTRPPAGVCVPPSPFLRTLVSLKPFFQIQAYGHRKDSAIQLQHVNPPAPFDNLWLFVQVFFLHSILHDCHFQYTFHLPFVLCSTCASFLFAPNPLRPRQFEPPSPVPLGALLLPPVPPARLESPAPPSATPPASPPPPDPSLARSSRPPSRLRHCRPFFFALLEPTWSAGSSWKLVQVQSPRCNRAAASKAWAACSSESK